LLWLLPSIAHAQLPRFPWDPGDDEQKILQGLKSESEYHVMWAAWRASVSPRNSMHYRQPLLDAFQRVFRSATFPSRAIVCRFLLDGLITIGAKANVLEAYDEFPDMVLALAARAHANDKDPNLMALLERADRENNAARWLVLVATVDHRSREEFILDRIRFPITIKVDSAEPRKPLLQYENAPYGVLGGILGNIPPPTEWPVYPASYCLTVTPKEGDVLLIKWPGLVFLRKFRNEQNTCDVKWRTSKDALSLSFLSAGLAHRSEVSSVPKLAGFEATVRWAGPEETRREIQKVVDLYLEHCRKLFALRAKLKLPARSWTDAEWHSRLALSLVDQRLDQSVPLPSFPFVIAPDKQR
jgi:hypothetical protein